MMSIHDETRKTEPVKARPLPPSPSYEMCEACGNSDAECARLDTAKMETWAGE